MTVHKSEAIRYKMWFYSFCRRVRINWQMRMMMICLGMYGFSSWHNFYMVLELHHYSLSVLPSSMRMFQKRCLPFIWVSIYSTLPHSSINAQVGFHAIDFESNLFVHIWKIIGKIYAHIYIIYIYHYTANNVLNHQSLLYSRV